MINPQNYGMLQVLSTDWEAKIGEHRVRDISAAKIKELNKKVEEPHLSPSRRLDCNCGPKAQSA